MSVVKSNKFMFLGTADREEMVTLRQPDGSVSKVLADTHSVVLRNLKNRFVYRLQFVPSDTLDSNKVISSYLNIVVKSGRTSLSSKATEKVVIDLDADESGKPVMKSGESMINEVFDYDPKAASWNLKAKTEHAFYEKKLPLIVFYGPIGTMKRTLARETRRQVFEYPLQGKFDEKKLAQSSIVVIDENACRPFGATTMDDLLHGISEIVPDRDIILYTTFIEKSGTSQSVGAKPKELDQPDHSDIDAVSTQETLNEITKLVPNSRIIKFSSLQPEPKMNEGKR